MNFCIFADFENELRPLFEIRRTKSGLYVNNIGSKYKDHFSYHSNHPDYPDGLSHHTSRKARSYKMPRKDSYRPPLDEFVGPETIMTHNFILNEIYTEKKREVASQDVVLKNLRRECSVEILLSDIEIQLEERDDRRTLDVVSLTNVKPKVIAEAYIMKNSTLCFGRYEVKNPFIFIE